jgi:hypothetical protein
MGTEREPAVIAHEPTLFDVADARPLVHVDPARERRSLRDHHVRIEPGKGITSIAYLVDAPKVRDIGAGPYVALCRLLAAAALAPHVIPPGPTPCARCAAPNTCIADSPKGTDRVTWYCDHPCIP